MAELLIVIVCIGLLAAIAVPTVGRVRDALADSAKSQNATKLNEYMNTLFNAGVDMSTYATKESVLDALVSAQGITIPSPHGDHGTVIVIRIDKPMNPTAYDFVAGDADHAPHFTAIVGQHNVSP